MGLKANDVQKSPGCPRDDVFHSERHLAPADSAEDLNGMKVTCQTILLSVHISPHPSYDDMSFRQSFSRFRKKAKDKLSNTGSSKKGEKANTGGERFDRPTLFSQSEPAIVVENELEEDIRVRVGKDDSRPGNSLSISQPMTELERQQGGSDDCIARREPGQKGLHPHVYERASRESSQEREDVDRKMVDPADPPPRSEPDIGRTSIPPVVQNSESEGT
jgi:hypothetical protein